MNVPFDHFFIMLHGMPQIQKLHLRHTVMGKPTRLNQIVLTIPPHLFEQIPRCCANRSLLHHTKSRPLPHGSISCSAPKIPRHGPPYGHNSKFVSCRILVHLPATTSALISQQRRSHMRDHIFKTRCPQVLQHVLPKT